MDSIEFGILGGSGFYRMPGFESEEQVTLKTPFGDPSGPYHVGMISGKRVAFLARHGDGHRLGPSEINFRANIYGFKILGAGSILSSSAVGSLKEAYAPGDIVVPDQAVDRTCHRHETFFGDGIVAHTSFAEPFCPRLRRALVEACREEGVTTHERGTYICIEGPQFSSKAESFLYRSWGMDVIGMTNVHEAKLAREAEICYATLSLVTDYDCWHPDHASVEICDVLRILSMNAEHAQSILRSVIGGLPADGGCSCRTALDDSVITRRDLWPEETYHRLRPLLGRVLGEDAGGG